MVRPVRAEIDLSALKHNFHCVKNYAPGSRIMAVIKSDAYGHGLIPIAKALTDADAYAVESVEVARQLISAGLDKPVVLLEGFFSESELSDISSYQFESVCHHESQLEILESCKLRQPVKIWLKLDTGMGRLGFSVDVINDVYERLLKNHNVSSVSIMTHLSDADDPDSKKTIQQTGLFIDATGGLNVDKSIANSAALIAWPDTHADWVRPGIMLYGSYPFKNNRNILKPVMTLSTRLNSIKTLKKGDSVGYGSEWHCPEDMRVGIAAIGYGDGYPRHVTRGTPVLINGKMAAVIGRVSMDMINVDLRNHEEAEIGDDVICWGKGLSADLIAEYSGTIAYELFCQVTSRVPRVYVT